ncbi:MAG TPA: DUF222 domain-containing protein, partial [Candidatus Eisenbacteria bacterium]|nr:DUF222 domain-containing protein [Candidatus Eisenbacteria bacterium]
MFDWRGGVEALAAAIDGLAGQDLDPLDDAALGGQLVELHRLVNALQAQLARRLERFDRRGGAAGDGAASTAAWLRARCRLGPGAAREQVVIARQLADELPATRAGFAAGRLSAAHVRVIAAAARQMPDDMVAEAEATLAAAAADTDPARLGDRLKQLRHQLQPEAVVAAEHDAYSGRYLHAARTLDGMVSVSGLLDPDTGSLFLTLLSALLQAPGPAEPLTRGQRQADAFHQLLTHATAAPDLPTARGERPTLLVLADLATLEARAGANPAALAWTGPASGEAARRIACDANIARVLTRGRGEILDLGRKTR